VLRKQLTALEEARAVAKMLTDGYTLNGAATVLGWSKRLVSSRARILELPEPAQTLVGTGEIPVSAIDALLTIQSVAPKLCELVADVIAEAAEQNNPLGEQLARERRRKRATQRYASWCAPTPPIRPAGTNAP
jgi:hypothetical protein